MHHSDGASKARVLEMQPVLTIPQDLIQGVLPNKAICVHGCASQDATQASGLNPFPQRSNGSVPLYDAFFSSGAAWMFSMSHTGKRIFL